MIGKIREDWRRFKASRPGYRFRDRYHYRKRRSRGRSSQGRFDLWKALYIVAGIAIAIASLVFAPLPGPGLGTFLLGLLILAGELLIVARFLDRAEMKLRGPARRAENAWASLPRGVKMMLGAVFWISGAAAGLWALLYGLR